jgi:hypothetical protein
MTMSDDSRPSDKLDIADDELEIVDAYEAGQLNSVATEAERAGLMAAASATPEAGHSDWQTSPSSAPSRAR